MIRLKTETAVGLFIIASVILLFAIALWVGTWRYALSPYTAYTLYTNDVAGLTKKSDVRIAGVKVGTVQSIMLVENGLRARVTIGVLRQFPIHADATATVRQDGLLGAKYLDLWPGTSKNSELEHGDVLPQPQAQASSAEGAIQNLCAAAQSADETLRVIRERTLEKTQENLERITLQIETAAQDLARAARALEQFIQVAQPAVLQSVGAMQEMTAPVIKATNEFQQLAHELRTITAPAVTATADEATMLMKNVQSGPRMSLFRYLFSGDSKSA